ncbi:benzoate/H(+) symporter BenE family transporter [Psychromonas sp. KJ10-10]|uniref:benzoate/H(+) symporter BenE family transporter n=1 Tax=Psychromonas sp. KJ10-10 TaxID=3391823 RepID=UPI0039B36D3C
MLMLGLTIGGTSIGLSLYYRLPILIAWSTPGASLLIANVQGFSINEAIAGFIVSGALILLCGLTGWFEKLISKIPFQLASAMLAGILINFGVDVFSQMNEAPWVVSVMLATYFISKQIMPKFAMLFVLVSCILLAWQFHLVSDTGLSWQVSEFHYIAPQFTLDVILGISLPLFIVTMAAQNLPGIAVFKAHNYDAPVSSILSVTGFVNMVMAPFGCFSINLVAITVAICMTDEVSEKPSERYWAPIAGGIVYLIMAIFSSYLMNVFALLPDALIYSLAGIALFSTIGNSLQQAVVASKVSEASIITFIVTASNITLWGLSSVLWGLIAGATILFIQQVFKRKVVSN